MEDPVFKFKILSSCRIGPIPHRFRQGELYVTKDFGEAEMLRRSISATELRDETKIIPQKAVQAVAQAEAETPEETTARLRSQMMDSKLVPWKRLQALAKQNSVRHVGKTRDVIVDAILEKTVGGQGNG